MPLNEYVSALLLPRQVFDASVNRISRLSRKSFARYTDIKLLYLFDNAIHSIEPGTFQQLTDLEAIDLSLNSLATLSLDLFGLPRLRNMYYNDNLLEWDRIDIDLQVFSHMGTATSHAQRAKDIIYLYICHSL